MFKMNVAALVLLFCAACVYLTKISGAQGTNTTSSPKVHAGQELFNGRCVQCHAVIAGQYSFGPNLAGEMKKPHRKNAAEVRTIIKEGKGKMPGFGDKLTSPEIDDLLVYLRTL